MKNETLSERNRIDSMLQNGRITADDHKILVEALQKKNRFLEVLLGKLVNPFQSLSSVTVLIAGCAAILAMSIIGAKLALHYRGALDFHVIEEGKRTFSFIELVIQNAVDVVCVSVFFYAGSVIAKARNLRVIDFVSSIAFARVPYAAFALVLFGASPFFPSLIPRKADAHDVTGTLVLAVIAIAFLAWHITLTFSALKESSGLRGKQLWANFIIGLILAEAASYAINTFIIG